MYVQLPAGAVFARGRRFYDFSVYVQETSQLWFANSYKMVKFTKIYINWFLRLACVNRAVYTLPYVCIQMAAIQRGNGKGGGGLEFVLNLF